MVFVSGEAAKKNRVLLTGRWDKNDTKCAANIADPLRFDNEKQVLKLAGYDLCAKRSGKNSAKARPVISKKGNATLRYGLYQAALVASCRNVHFIEYFTNTLRGREQERGIKTKMRVKLAAKMLVIAWTLMKKKETFNAEYLKPKNMIQRQPAISSNNVGTI